MDHLFTRRMLLVTLTILMALLAGSCGSSTADTTADSSSESDADADAAPATSEEDEPESEPSAESESAVASESSAESELFPDVVAVEADQDADGSWTFLVTLSSPYDTPERYADAWRVAGPDGEVYGVRELTHDHQSEQPFTRSQSGIVIPDGVTEVLVEGRDQVSGWGGKSIRFELAS